MARAALGPLLGLELTPARRARNLLAARKFLHWCQRCGYPLDDDDKNLETALKFYICSLWAEGEGRDAAADVLFGIRLLTDLDVAKYWRLYRVWAKSELPSQAEPAALDEILALAGWCYRHGHDAMGCGLLLAYDTFLRTGELLILRAVDFNSVIQPDGTPAVVIDLGLTKGVQRRGGVEQVVCTDPLLLRLIGRVLAAMTNADEPFVGVTPDSFRYKFRKAVRELGLSHRKLQPYSLRRGGLSSAAANGVPLSTLCGRARWWNMKVARLYIQEGKQLLASLQHSPQLKQQLKEAATWIPQR